MKIYDLAIIGGGPAGAAGAVYAARKRLNTVVITKDWLGQSNVSEKIENWVGTIAISGLELSQSLEKHAKAYGKDVLDFVEGQYVTKVTSNKGQESSKDTFTITTDKGSYQARAVLVTAGSRRRKLDVPGADTYEHKGLTYCATCDGPLYGDQDVIVVGGGNAGFESAAQLLAYCRTVTLLSRSEFKADPGTVEAVSKNPKFKGIEFAVPKEVKGDKFLTSLVYHDTKADIDVELKVTGVFAEIGSVPNTDFIKDIVALDGYNHLIVDAKNQRATTEGIWAAGDCTDGLYHQNNIAAGDAVKAIEDIYIWLQKNQG
ncbi:MAG TPA: FAD-dependent oxidoreductase [Candidatus Paceibacterota bacterium]|jgi:thioredoxin reductase|nr:FAD-dependent oxidoreductase [Candidatus Paceibacterota bacterium]